MVFRFSLETTTFVVAPVTPGKFVFVSLPHTTEIPITVSGFGKNTLEITVRNTGKVTANFFKLMSGDSIYWRGPYGNEFPLDNFVGQHLVLIAGGWGVAAIKSLIDYYTTAETELLKKLDIVIGFVLPSILSIKKSIKSGRKRVNSSSQLIATITKSGTAVSGLWLITSKISKTWMAIRV